MFYFDSFTIIFRWYKISLQLIHFIQKTKPLDMETYIAFFDILGFKEIVLNNDLKSLNNKFNDFLRESQISVSTGQTVHLENGIIVPDLSEIKVNCIHISDSVIFWTQNQDQESFNNLLNACTTFYRRSLQMEFPLRGAIVYGEMEFTPGIINDKEQNSFSNFSLIGKGLINAYLKAESLHLSACIVDQSALTKLGESASNELIKNESLFYYNTPFNNCFSEYVHLIRPLKGVCNELFFSNRAKTIKENFERLMYGKPMLQSIKEKMNNTIKLLEFFRNPSLIFNEVIKD